MAESSALFFVVILKFIFRSIIEIEVIEKQFLALEKYGLIRFNR